MGVTTKEMVRVPLHTDSPDLLFLKVEIPDVVPVVVVHDHDGGGHEHVLGGRAVLQWVDGGQLDGLLQLETPEEFAGFPLTAQYQLAGGTLIESGPAKAYVGGRVVSVFLWAPCALGFGQ